MKSNLRVLYRTTLAKYSKFKSRYDKNLKNGHFYELSQRKQSQIIARLRRLYQRLSQLKLQLKLAAATGILSLSLSTTEAQQLGPFVQNDVKNPFFRTAISESNVKTTFGDLDFDGDFDMVMGNGAGAIRFFRNDGDATNSRFVELTLKYNPFYGVTANNGFASPELIDLDGDGDLDLMLGARGTYGDRNIRFFENTDNEDGILGNELVFTEIAGAANPIDEINGQYNNFSTTQGDIDGDGDIDVLVANSKGYSNAYYTGNAFTLFRSGGGTTFTQENAYSALPGLPTFTYGDNDMTATLFDLDGDGDLDLFVGNGTFAASGQIRFFENNDINLPGDAVLGDNISFTELTGVNNPFNGIDKGYNASVTFVDLDGDGDDDAVIGSSFGIDFFENDANTFTEKFGYENPFDAFDFGEDVAPATADIDGDGFLDVVIGEKYSQSLLYFQNAQNGKFTQIEGASNPFDNILNPSFDRPVPAFADIDNDSDLDLFVSVDYYQAYPSPDISRVEFFRNNGSNVFVNESSPIPTIQNNIAISATVNDFDDDGDMDAIIGFPSASGASFTFSRNDGGVSWVDQPTGNAPFFGVDIAIGYSENAKPIMVDLDHDGDLDVVSGVHGSTISGQLAFFRNINNILLQQNAGANPFNGLTVGSDSHPSFLDIDNDGDLDALVGSYLGRLTLFENTNEAPTLSLAAGPINYTEGDGLITIDPTLNITDDAIGEGDLITEARVQILNYVAGEDVLTFTPSSNPDANITGIFETTGLNAGTLILTGVDTIKNFLPVLQSVRYENTSISPSTVTRNIQFSVTDWDNTNPNSASISINIASVNSAPSVTASAIANATYTEDDTPGVLIDGGLLVNDIDNTTLVGATIQITTKFISSEDVLEFTNQNGITGIYDNTTGILTLSGTASVTNYQTALRSVRYANSSQDPNIADRTIEFTVNDGTDASNIAGRTVLVISVNDAPIISSGNTAAIDYTQNTAAIIVDDLIDITDVDNTQLVSASVAISGYQTGDILAGTAPTGGTSNFNAATGILTFTGSATLTDYITALATVTFSSDQTGSRQIMFTVNDGTDDSNIYNRDLNIINLPPVIASSGSGTLDYTQNEPAIIIDNLITITDSDDTDMESLTVTISGFVSGDLLAITEPAGTTANFDANTGILTITGTAPIGDYQTSLQGLSFSSSNASGTRQFLIIANDGTDDSNIFSIDVNILDEAQPPIVNTTPATTQEGNRLTIDLCAIISDPDNTFDELTITVVSILSGAITEINGCDLIIDYEGLDFFGTDSIVISATDPDGNTDQNTLTITVEEEPIVNGGKLLIYNAISPNGDGANDWWEIVNLTTPNQIELYNRWGDLVKTLNDYENIENNTQLDDLPVGTYFYKISSPQGEYTGYITIKK